MKLTPLSLDPFELYFTSCYVSSLFLCLVEFLCTAIFLRSSKPENPGKLSWNVPRILWCGITVKNVYKKSGAIMQL